MFIPKLLNKSEYLLSYKDNMWIKKDNYQSDKLWFLYDQKVTIKIKVILPYLYEKIKADC